MLPLFLRVHTRAGNKKRWKSDGEGKLPDKWARFALVFDCETTTDIRQDLNFLWWRFCELKNDRYVCQQEGIAYADKLDKKSIKLIQEFARGRRANVEEGCPEEITVGSRTTFVNGEFWDAVSAGAAIVCFNAPFDLSRLALEYRKAQSKNTGWSIVLKKYKGKPDKMMPRLRIKPKDSRSAFISLAGGDHENRVVYAGRFLDLSVFVWALRNQHMTLDSALDSFHLEGKMKHEPTGLVTKQELKYGRRDVERTLALLNATKREYDGFPIDLPPERAMSAASITKAFLDKMRIEEPANKFKLPDHISGKCMQAYYGGRSEIRIRHTEMPVMVCDATSEYPSVAALLDLWPLLVAASVEVVYCTKEARKTLGRITSETLLDRSTWRNLAFFASVKPSGQILPARSLYADLDKPNIENSDQGITEKSGNPNIGVNPLFARKPIWYAGPDLAAAKLIGQQTPHIIRAFKLVPRGLQLGMKSTSIGTRKIDPEKDDFFLTIIEERQNLPKKHPHYLLLKIIANSLYGIFAELNKYEYGKNSAKRLKVFSGENRFRRQTCVVEYPGRWQFPPAAALITAGGRLILAILEEMTKRKQGMYLLTDTDSMFFVASKNGGLVPCAGGPHKMGNGDPAVKALTWRQVNEICAKLNGLNPYNRTVVEHILKIEACNSDRAGKPHQLYALAVSAKRYAVYTRKKGIIEIIKPSEHGLGMVYVPDKRKPKRYKPTDCKDKDTDYPRWIVEAWEYLLNAHLQNVTDAENTIVTRKLWFGDFPAVMRIRVTTPNVMKALRKRDPGAAKPYNFALSPILLEPIPDCTLVGSFSKHPEEWLNRNYIEIHTGKTVKLNGEYRGKKLKPQTLGNVVWRHYLHPEAKSLGPDGKPCRAYTNGLLQRRPIEAMIPFRLIGKEIERKSQEGEDISALEFTGPIEYQRGQTAKTRAADTGLIMRAKRFQDSELRHESGKSQHAVERFLAGKNVHPDTRTCVLKGVEKLERKQNEK